MRVSFFGAIAEQVGRSVELDAAPATIAELRALLVERFPHAREALLRPSLRASVGDDVVDDAFPLDGVEAVDFFPPVSGG